VITFEDGEHEGHDFGDDAVIFEKSFEYKDLNDTWVVDSKYGKESSDLLMTKYLLFAFIDC
jgi:hypothetical protein